MTKSVFEKTMRSLSESSRKYTTAKLYKGKASGEYLSSKRQK